MKKVFTMLCMLTCVLGLTACGGQELSTAEQNRGETAGRIAADFVVPFMTSFFDDGTLQSFQSNYDVHEMEYIAEEQLNYVKELYATYYGLTYNVDKIDVEGNAIYNGAVSYNGTYDSLGTVDLDNLLLQPSYEYSNSKDTIIVTVPITGTAVDADGNPRVANAEVIFSNDIFLTVEGISLNLDQSMGELMGKAGMDTLMGMGTVFSVLILISILIWAMGSIIKGLQTSAEKRKKEKALPEKAVENTIAQIVEKEENAGDELELAAVIAAAIAASRGEASADGFVVRSIRKRI